MFGMLDYRAHKLFWLIMLPFRIFFWILFFVIVFLSVVIAFRISTVFLYRIIIAFFLMEIINFIFVYLLSILMFNFIKKIFFWIVDVVPSYGSNPEEAEMVVLIGGKLFQLVTKLNNEIENWTDNDTCAFIPLAFNWRERIFFNPTERVKQRVAKLQKIQRETGKELRELGEYNITQIRESYKDGHATWIESAIVSPMFNDILGFVIIVVCMYYMQ